MPVKTGFAPDLPAAAVPWPSEQSPTLLRRQPLQALSKRLRRTRPTAGIDRGQGEGSTATVRRDSPGGRRPLHRGEFGKHRVEELGHQRHPLRTCRRRLHRHRGYCIQEESPMTTAQPMQIGMIGLGRMGANLVRRLMRDGHRCVATEPPTPSGNSKRREPKVHTPSKSSSPNSKSPVQGSWCRPRPCNPLWTNSAPNGSRGHLDRQWQLVLSR